MRRLLSFALVLVLVLGLAVAPASAAGDPARPNRAVERPSGVLAPLGNSPATSSRSGLNAFGPAEAAGGVSALIATDDDLPGVPRQWWPGTFTDTVDTAIDKYDVYPVFLELGEEAAFALTAPAGDFDLGLLYPDGTLAVESIGEGTDEWVGMVADEEGYWYVVVGAYSGSGAYTLTGGFVSPEDDIFWDDGFTTPDLAASPAYGYLDSFSDWDDVSKVWLNTGDTLHVTLTTANSTAGFVPDLYIFGPDAIGVYESAWIADTEVALYPKSLTVTATQPGYHYLDVYEYNETDHNYGNTALTYTIDRVPLVNVYRFYNTRLGTHFYTASESEKANVIATLGAIFTFEGPAYAVNPLQNATPLYRFYNLRTGTHFYTASESEKANVIATLGAIFTFEGPAYNVCGAPGVGRTPVYRFYNVRNGTHFYTASEAERDNVKATLSTVYQYEGVGFWYGL